MNSDENNIPVKTPDNLDCDVVVRCEVITLKRFEYHLYRHFIGLVFKFFDPFQIQSLIFQSYFDMIKSLHIGINIPIISVV